MSNDLIGLKKVEKNLVLAILLITAISTVVDLFEDYNEGVSFNHILTEMIILVFSMFGIVILIRSFFQAKNKNVTLNIELNQTKEDLTVLKEETQLFLENLSDYIDNQFALWGFTVAEKEIGLMMLRGLPFKEISHNRGTSERTVRLQAQAIYKKTHIAGRAEFSAYFIEKIILKSKKN